LNVELVTPGSITRTFRDTPVRRRTGAPWGPWLVAAALLVAGTAAQSAETWRDAPEFVGIFAPAAHRDAYRAAVSDATLDAVLAGLADDPSLVRTPGAWTARSEPALDAFGRSGSYDRWKLARLYGSRQPRVARGARSEDGWITESWMLVSPYPSADFTRLQPGTLRLVLRVERAGL
jgi:hypothetical protein